MYKLSRTRVIFLVLLCTLVTLGCADKKEPAILNNAPISCSLVNIKQEPTKGFYTARFKLHNSSRDTLYFRVGPQDALYCLRTGQRENDGGWAYSLCDFGAVMSTGFTNLYPDSSYTYVLRSGIYMEIDSISFEMEYFRNKISPEFADTLLFREAAH